MILIASIAQNAYLRTRLLLSKSIKRLLKCVKLSEYCYTIEIWGVKDVFKKIDRPEYPSMEDDFGLSPNNIRQFGLVPEVIFDSSAFRFSHC